MHEQHSEVPAWFLLAALALFVGSGCAALIYEVVWFQLLELVLGSSAISLGLLLATFMGGMCLGSLLLPRFVAGRNPLLVYAALEGAIGLFGLFELFGMPWIGRLYSTIGGGGIFGIFSRGIVAALCLLPPTILMGATLPVISRCVDANPRGISYLGLFYGGNLVGAVVGCLTAGFYLLRIYDLATATYVAFAINFMVAMAATLMGMRSEFIQDSGEVEFNGNGSSSSVYLTIAISGFCALSAEVIWTRVLSLLLGATVYTFSIILAVFLIGLAIGSSLGSVIARSANRARVALGACQLCLIAAIAWTAYMLSKSLPFWPVSPLLTRDVWLNFQFDLARCFWAVLPPTIFWGASFPLALAAAAPNHHDTARMVGKIYAANTLGAILGAVITSLLFIRWLGSQHAQQVLIALSAVAASMMLMTSLRVSQLLPALAATILGVLFLVNVPEIPWQLVAFGKYLLGYKDPGKLLYAGEGLNSSVAVTEVRDGVRKFHVSGKVEASSGGGDMRLQRMLGHLPALFHPRPRSVLVVGCGAGVTAGSFLVYPEIERIVICELEPLIPQKVAPFFSKENYNLISDPRVHVIYDDARHYIFTTKEKFDIITSDPIHPWVKGAATLYTKQYFEMCKNHLNPGGFATQWVPLYQSDTAVVKSEFLTFFKAFPAGTIWSNEERPTGTGYDVVLLGNIDQLRINVDQLQARLAQNPLLAHSLKAVGFPSVTALLASYCGRDHDLAPWLKNAEINDDRSLRLQYLAGMTSNLYLSGPIYKEMLLYRKYPEGLFSGSDENIRSLRSALKISK